MTPEQRRFVGIILILIGVLSFGIGSAVFAAVVKDRKEAQKAYSEQQQMCATRLKALGGTITEIPGRIVWLKQDIEQGPALLGQASVAAVMCPGWKMRTACIGTECPDPNAMRIVLSPINTPDE